MAGSSHVLSKGEAKATESFQCGTTVDQLPLQGLI